MFKEGVRNISVALQIILIHHLPIWKRENVVTLFKKGNREDENNYRLLP